MRSAIEHLLTQPEGKTLEFKRDLSSPRNLLKTLVAFANSAGGIVLIGVADDRTVIGLEQPLDDEERLDNLIGDAIAPRLVPNVEILSWQDRSILAVEVFPGSNRPYYLKSEGQPDGVYVRLGSSNRQAGSALAAELRRSSEGIVFDEMPMPDLGPDDLDIQAAQRLFSDRRKLDEQALLSLRVLVRDQGRLVPSKGGMLLFGKDRGAYFPDAWVQCGRFIGVDKAHIFDHVEIHASLPDCVEQVMLFLKKHAIRGADFSNVRRQDVWSIPLLILREAVTNALVHADYSHPGAPIRVAFFDDRIEVESPGILVPGMTIEEMRQGVSNLRNRVIARVFRELGLIEQWGSGVRRMFREASELGLPEPVIEEIGMHLRITVFIGQNRLMKTSAKSGVESGVESEDGPSVSWRVLHVLKEGTPLSKIEIAKALGRTRPNRYLDESMRRLIAADEVAYTLPEKPNSRLQKYRLTEKGKARLSRMGNE